MLNKSQKNSITKLSVVAMLSAMSFILMLLEFPIIPGLDHLKLDFSDIPALVAGIAYGPVAGIAVEFIKNLIELLVKGVGTQMGFGNLMNFIVGCAYVVPFSICYRKLYKKIGKTKGVLLSSILGILSIIVFGAIANYFVAPLFFKYFLGITLDSAGIKTAVIGATAINAIKGTMLSILCYPIVKFLLNKLLYSFK